MRFSPVILSLLFVACGEIPTPESVLLSEEGPENPVLLELSYRENGTMVVLTPPMAGFQVVRADLGLAPCGPDQGRFVLKGTADVPRTVAMDLKGAPSFTSSMHGGSFEAQFCLPLGSASLSLRALDKDQNRNRIPIEFSVNLSVVLTTIGAGHPHYPRPGFRSHNGVVPNSVLTQPGSLQLENLSVGDLSSPAVTGTGNTSLVMGAGYVHVLRETQP